MTYTQWLIELISIILKDNEGMTIDDLALTDAECFKFFNDGTPPANVYNNAWQKCAGNYYAIKF